MPTNAAIDTETALLAGYLDQPVLARELGIATKTLDRWGKEGRGPAVTKIGRRVMYSRKAVTEWLAACERDPHRRDHRFLPAGQTHKRRSRG
jgi:predicted DNA-binding transcriptional regulator AlpA